MNCILGLDTSCYTTSVAAVTLHGELIAQQRRLIHVPQGQRGARQSDALFQHVQALPALTEALMHQLGPMKISAVAASFTPRDVEGSYMPVFTAGAGAARQWAALEHCPLYALSHQQGHVMAALYGSPLKPEDQFVALHLSGGTTEVLWWNNGQVKQLGGSDDLHAGQFVDRVGVALGLPFPAGPHMEKLASEQPAESLFKSSVRGMNCSLSGAESAAQRCIAQGMKPEKVAAEVYNCLARTIAKMIAAAVEETEQKNVLLSGGVAASALLRQLLQKRLAKICPQVKLHFGRTELCGDNAVGVALWGAWKYREE